MIKYTGHVIVMRNESTGDIQQYYYPIADWIQDLDRILPPPSYELSMAYGEAVSKAMDICPDGYEIVSVIAV